MDRALGDFLEASGLEEAGDASAIHDVERVRGLLIAAAKARHALSYSQILGQLGLRFSRPKMRSLCRTLDAIDAEGALRGEPGLAVLVVRESDGLPGTRLVDRTHTLSRRLDRATSRPLRRAATAFGLCLLGREAQLSA